MWSWLVAAAFLLPACGTAGAQWGREPDGSGLEQATRASIVFATHDLSSPVSLFGHSFLVLHHDATPEPQALVLEFGGITRSGLDHLRALVSEIEGGFTLSFLSYKEREYFSEGRSLWIYPLRLEPSELATLKQQVRASIGQRARYTFARWNCSHHILEVVARSVGIDRAGPELPFVVPVDTLRTLQARGRLGAPMFRASPGTRAQAAYRALSDADRARLQSLWLDPDQVEAEAASGDLGQALSASADHWMLREAQASRRDAWYRLKRRFPLSGAEAALPAASGRSATSTTPSDPASSRGPSEWTLAHDFRQGTTAVGWRLGLLSLAGEEGSGLRNARLQLLAVDVEQRNGDTRVARAELLAMEANVPGDLYFAGFTQRLDVGYADDRLRLNRISRRALVQFGRGTSRAMAGVDLSVLPTVAVGAVNGGAGWRPALAAGIKASAYVALPGSWRAKFTSQWNGRELAGVRSSHQFQVASPLIRKTSTVTLQAEWRNQNYRDASVGLLWAYRMAH